MSVSFFFKTPYQAKRDHHLQRVSSIIRGIQIAEYIRGKVNPTDGYQEDVCIYVKPHVKSFEDFNFEGHPYLDIIDGWSLLTLAQKHQEVTIITCSYHDFEYVSSQVTNRVLLIPQQHCNFERIHRIRKEVKIAGVIGTKEAFRFIPNSFYEEFNKRGMELVAYSDFRSRQDIINFYKGIDLQVVWRPYMKRANIPLSNPLKIVNAASFGIPTLALDEPAFHEMNGCYVPIYNTKQFFMRLDRIRTNTAMYEEYSKKCLEMSEKYHISTIAKLYQALT